MKKLLIFSFIAAFAFGASAEECNETNCYADVSESGINPAQVRRIPGSMPPECEVDAGIANMYGVIDRNFSGEERDFEIAVFKSELRSICCPDHSDENIILLFEGVDNRVQCAE
jgi:hypothetical protein